MGKRKEQTIDRCSPNRKTTQTAKITMHHTAWYNAVCSFIIKKPHKLHRTAPSLYINMFIFLILNILLIV